MTHPVDPALLFTRDTEATLFRRYRCDGSGSLGAVREERILDGTVAHLADCFARPLPAEEGEYFLATDTQDFDWNVVLAMKADGGLRSAADA